MGLTNETMENSNGNVVNATSPTRVSGAMWISAILSSFIRSEQKWPESHIHGDLIQKCFEWNWNTRMSRTLFPKLWLELLQTLLLLLWLNAQMPSGCCQRCSFHTTPGSGIGKSPRRWHHFQATRYINVNHLETNRFFDVLCLRERQVTSRSGQEIHHPWTWLISRQYG